MKKIKNAIYIFRGRTYKSFKEMKTVAYFEMKADEEECGYMMIGDEVWIEYKMNKAERRIICRKVYDYEEKAMMDWNSRQLKIW